MKLLKSLYSINSKSGHEEIIKSFVRKELKDVECSIKEDDFGNMYITKGHSDSYPGITAHLDEVHSPGNRCIVFENDIVFGVDNDGNRCGIGADDKNGIWVIINLLRERPILKAVLFVQEEKDNGMAGCRGSKACSLSMFDNLSYLLAIDRSGYSDVITTSKNDIVLCDESFLPAEVLSKYGYKCAVGGRTDVTVLRERGLKIPCCNISCGYYNPHKTDEFTIFPQLANTLSFVSALLDALERQQR